LVVGGSGNVANALYMSLDMSPTLHHNAP
jgi:hypothetical protein